MRAISMTSDSPAGGQHRWNDFGRAARAVPSPVLQGMMAAALLCGLLAGLLPAMARVLHAPPWFAAMAPIAALQPVADASDALPSRCQDCGVVESIRALEPAEGSSAAYQFNVRLRDGSLRTSTTDGKASWRVGDHILLVGGSARR